MHKYACVLNYNVVKNVGNESHCKNCLNFRVLVLHVFYSLQNCPERIVKFFEWIVKISDHRYTLDSIFFMLCMFIIVFPNFYFSYSGRILLSYTLILQLHSDILHLSSYFITNLYEDISIIFSPFLFFSKFMHYLQG